MGRAKKEEQMAAMMGKGAPMGQPPMQAPQPSVKDLAQATLKDLLKPPQPNQGPQ